LLALERTTSDFFGGKGTQVWLVADNAEATVTIVASRDPQIPFWSPSSLRLRVRQPLDQSEESAGMNLLQRVILDLECAWACIGDSEVVVGPGLGSGGGMGMPRVGWANYVSTDEYDLQGLEYGLAEHDTVTVAR